jgi:tyrosyl-tRNA synthetase
MSKSADNYIGLQEPPEAMFRKAMQIGDDVVFRFFELLSRRSNEEIAALKAEKASGRNPMEIKALFAREIVERFHGAAAASTRRASSSASTRRTRSPTTCPRWRSSRQGPVAELAWALKQAGLVVIHERSAAAGRARRGRGRRWFESGPRTVGSRAFVSSKNKE